MVIPLNKLESNIKNIMSISLIIPTYRNPEFLDLTINSALKGQKDRNEIIVVVDGFIDESQHIIDKYRSKVNFLELEQNGGLQTALNLGVYNASNEVILIINDDNVLCPNWDEPIQGKVDRNFVFTFIQIEPNGPSIFGFNHKDLGRNPSEFDYDKFTEYEKSIKSNKLSNGGGIFPFAMTKTDYMIVGGFDTLYDSPFICDWDFFLKLDLMGCNFYRINSHSFYHFGGISTSLDKNIKLSEKPAAQTFLYKWGIPPRLYPNNSHRPINKPLVKGIQF